MCNNTLLGQRLNLSSSSDIFDNLIKKNEWETLIRLFSLNILDINHRDCKGRNILYFAILNKKYEYIKILKAFPHQKTNAYLSGLVKLNHKIKTKDEKEYSLLVKLQQIQSFWYFVASTQEEILERLFSISQEQRDTFIQYVKQLEDKTFITYDELKDSNLIKIYNLQETYNQDDLDILLNIPVVQKNSNKEDFQELEYIKSVFGRAEEDNGTAV